MEKYSLRFKKSVIKDFRKMPNKDVKRILICIDSLCDNPRMEGTIKLSEQELYRVRLGMYRIVYEIQDLELVIVVIKVAHRSDIYKAR